MHWIAVRAQLIFEGFREYSAQSGLDDMLVKTAEEIDCSMCKVKGQRVRFLKLKDVLKVYLVCGECGNCGEI